MSCKGTCAFIPLAAVGPGPLKDLQVASMSCTGTSLFTPIAAVGPGPLKDLQVASLGCLGTREYIPLASVGPGPLKDLQVASMSCTETRLFIPPAAVGPGPLKDLQVTSSSCLGTRVFIPLAAVGPEPLKDLQVASSGCSVAKSAPREPLAKSPRHELHASDEVIDIQPSQSSFVLLHRGRGTPANLRHPPEDCEPGGALERLGDEFHLAVRQIREGGRHTGACRSRRKARQISAGGRADSSGYGFYICLRGLSDFRAVAGSGSRRLSTQVRGTS